MRCDWGDRASVPQLGSHMPLKYIAALQAINAPDAPLIMRTQLFRDGCRVYEGPSQPLDTRSPKVAGRFFTHAAIEIPGDLAPGDYLLRVDVEDRALPPRQTRAWQWAWLTVSSR